MPRSRIDQSRNDSQHDGTNKKHDQHVSDDNRDSQWKPVDEESVVRILRPSGQEEFKDADDQPDPGQGNKDVKDRRLDRDVAGNPGKPENHKVADAGSDVAHMLEGPNDMSVEHIRPQPEQRAHGYAGNADHDERRESSRSDNP
ncbi:hypothetical protein OY671_009998 [Metschnikowia pulcherrima]|nr:hypothetical protein OY671_009998 [Metschnikowia pulcherrima]